MTLARGMRRGQRPFDGMLAVSARVAGPFVELTAGGIAGEFAVRDD